MNLLDDKSRPRIYTRFPIGETFVETIEEAKEPLRFVARLIVDEALPDAQIVEAVRAVADQVIAEHSAKDGQ
jgi:hypothetical protein